jgi:hypothetical protein
MTEKRSAGLLLCAALVAGCHGADGWDALTGTVVDTYVTETGDVPVPWGPKDVSLSAVCPGADDWTTIAGTIDEVGAFTIPHVPSRDCYLRMLKAGDGSWPVFVLAAVPRIDMGTVHLGRPDAEQASQPTPLAIDADPMSPWAAGDELDLFSLGAGASDHALEQSGGAIDVGASSLQGYSVDLSQRSNAHLVNGGRGDHLFVSHFTTKHAELAPDIAKHASILYSGLEEVLRPEPPSQRDGESARVSGGFAPVRSTPVTLDWRMSAFFNEARHVHPQARGEGHFVSVHADPSGPRRSTDDDLPNLLSTGYKTDKLTLDFPFTAALANPFPAGWTIRVSVWSEYSVSWLPGDVRAGIATYGPLSELTGQPLDPKITPPREPSIDGNSVWDPGRRSGLTPLLRWQAPPESAHLYSVSIHQQDPSGRWLVAAAFVTSETFVRFPPGVLQPGTPWVAFIFAHDNRSLAAPNAVPSRGAYATTVTALLTP